MKNNNDKEDNGGIYSDYPTAPIHAYGNPLIALQLIKKLGIDPKKVIFDVEPEVIDLHK